MSSNVNVPYNIPLLGQTFESLDAARKALDAATAEEGFKMRIYRTRPTQERAKYVVFECYKAPPRMTNEPKETDPSKQRNNRTRLSASCPYQLGLKLGFHGWTFKPVIGVGRDCHNHRFVKMANFARHRQTLLAPKKEQIIRLAKNGMAPTQIWGYLQDEPEDLSCIKVRDIQNILADHRHAQLVGQSPVEWMFAQLADSDRFWYRVLPEASPADGQSNPITGLFIAPATSVELLRQHPDVVLMDCTYKTNRFCMPLFNICGTTNDHRSFQIAACFLSGEKEADYSWALRCLGQFYDENQIPLPKSFCTDRELSLINSLQSNPTFNDIPQLLCRWHVNINVLAKTRQWFPKPTVSEDGAIIRHPTFKQFIGAYNRMIQSPSVEEFNQRYDDFRNSGFPEQAVNYVNKVWIDPWKTKIVACFVNQHTHFGHVTTSIVESSHASLKRRLLSRTGNLGSVFESLVKFWSYQVNRIEQERSELMDRVPMNTDGPLFDNIRQVVVHKALRLLVLEQKKLVWDKETESWASPSEPCLPCPILTTHGLPCYHIIFDHYASKTPLSPTLFHPHWFWERLPDPAANQSGLEPAHTTSQPSTPGPSSDPMVDLDDDDEYVLEDIDDCLWVADPDYEVPSDDEADFPEFIGDEE